MAGHVINQFTIVGTGLIGGSFGLALKQCGFAGRIVGCDRPEVLIRAEKRGAIDRGEQDPLRSTIGSQVVVLATPVMTIMDVLSRVGSAIDPGILLTDTGSTKAAIAQHAAQTFGNDALARFLPGHPIAGKEHGGIEEADADLFSGATWVLTPPGGVRAIVSPEFTRGVHGEFMSWLERIGARIIVLEPDQHDRLCAFTSHLPQMVSTALAATVNDAVGNEPALPALAGAGLRDTIRLAASDYAMWRDIALTNTRNLSDALLRMEQTLAHIRENLRNRELQAEFENAHKLDLETPPEVRSKDDPDPPKF